MGSTTATHREAYPKFDIFAALRGWKAGAPLCEFYDERGQRVGDLLIEKVTPRSMVVTGLVTPTFFEGFRKFTKTFVLSPDPNPVDLNRVALRCLGCNGNVRAMFLRGCWGCAGCHKLTHRAKLLQPAVLRRERLDQLRKQIGAGRPRHMRNATYAELRAEYESLTASGKTPAWPNEQHSKVVTGSWKPVEDVHPNYRSDFVRASDGFVRDFPDWETSPAPPHPVPARREPRMDFSHFAEAPGPAPDFD
jgi:hypothetical protein